MKISRSGIYLWKDSGKTFYVGQAIDMLVRIEGEERGSINDYAYSRMQDAKSKGTLTIEFIPKPIDDLDYWESYYIQLHDTMFPRGCNIQKGKYDLSSTKVVDFKPETLVVKRYGNIKRRIICLNDGKVFSNQNAVAAYYNINSGSVNHACKHQRDVVNNLMFCYVEDISVIKELPRSRVMDILGNMQEDEIDYMYSNTNIKDTVGLLKEKTDWKSDVMIKYNSKVYKKTHKW